jgi:YidC/Oxa1 family membrane protein insertase
VDQLFKLIAGLLSGLYGVVGSYGLSIVLLTLVVMTITTPLTIKGTKSMMQMQRLQPELKKIQERYRDDREKMNQELLAFYKANNINPVGGCLPMFIQLPVFAVLYRVLHGLTLRATTIGMQPGTTTANLRDAATLVQSDQTKRNFEPGYISKSSEMYRDLSKVNHMSSWGVDLSDNARSALSRSFGHALPYLVLIAIVAVTGVVQQRQIQGRSSGTAQVNSQQQMIMKIMPFFLPLISFGLPAGLVVYFVVSNLWRVGQQAFITHTLYNNANHPPIIESSAVEVQPAEKKTPVKAARAARVGGSGSVATEADESPARSVMGRNRREGATPAKPARLPAPAKPKPASPAASGRATPSGSSAAARPTKTKKKRK